MSHISYSDETWDSYSLPKEDPKNIRTTWHTAWFLLTSPFFNRDQQILLYQEIQIYIAFWYIIPNSFNFSWVLKIVLINMATILMMSTKIATPGLLKIKVFWSKGYDVMIYVHDNTNNFLWHDSNYIVDVVLWPKLS